MNFRKAKAHDKLKEERINSPRHFSQDRAMGIAEWKKPNKPQPRYCAYRHCKYYKAGHTTACCVACSSDMYEDMANVITTQIQRALTSRGVSLAKALKISALGIEAVALGLKQLAEDTGHKVTTQDIEELEDAAVIPDR